MNRYEQAYRFSHSWFRDEGGHDFFMIDDFSFGLLSQVYVYQQVLRGLEMEHTDGGDRSGRRLSFQAIIRFLKKHHLDSNTRQLGSSVYALRHGLSEQILGAPDILFVFDVWNSAMINSLLAVRSKIPKDRKVVSLCFDPRVFKQVSGRHNGTPVLFRGGRTRGDDRQSEAIYTQIRAVYHKERNGIQKLVKQQLPRHHDSFMEWIDRLIARFYRQTCRDYIVLGKSLERHRPSCVVLASDSHKFARMVTLLARRLGVKSFVIQHGATVGKHAYVPLFADRIAVWGQISRQWFLENDVPAERIVVTGAPGLDRLFELKRSSAGSTDNKNGVPPTLVVATNPIGQSLNFRFWNIVCEGLRPLSAQCQIVLKLHPGESDQDFFAARAKESRLPWNIVTRGDIHELILRAAAVITTQSTVGIEAVAGGTPLIVVDVPDLQCAIPYKDYRCVRSVTTSDALAATVRSILDSDAVSEEGRRSAERFVQDYLYKVDGNAAQRVVEMVLRD
ncbi:MAG TPA: hypothetical protein VN285_09435 [Candidatus Deferrimicrobium sp.]|nr:hypothetical protein [Candidatus Deferrimicrobium sp.]